MKTLIVGVALFAVLIAPVSAETRHDRKLEQAMMDILAAKIGNIRGGFAYDREPEFVTARDEVTTGSIATDSRTGRLVRAAGRKAPHFVSF